MSEADRGAFLRDPVRPALLSTVRAWATRIGGRYMGSRRADEYGARNGVPGELLVRVTPTRSSGATDVAD